MRLSVSSFAASESMRWTRPTQDKEKNPLRSVVADESVTKHLTSMIHLRREPHALVERPDTSFDKTSDDPRTPFRKAKRCINGASSRRNCSQRPLCFSLPYCSDLPVPLNSELTGQRSNQYSYLLYWTAGERVKRVNQGEPAISNVQYLAHVKKQDQRFHL